MDHTQYCEAKHQGSNVKILEDVLATQSKGWKIIIQAISFNYG